MAFDLTGLKDKSLSKLLLAAARQYLNDFGEVLDVALDTATRSVTVDLLPVGEREPIQVRVSGYGLEHDPAGGDWLTFDRLIASREWITRAAARLFPQHRLPLPAWAPVGLLRKLL